MIGAGSRAAWLLRSLVFTCALLAASPAFAYVGPGAGLSALGAVVALFAAIGLAIVGFVWYPVKRLRQRRRGGKRPAEKAVG